MRSILPPPLVLVLLAACNKAPEAPQIALNPGEPTTTDDISVIFLALTTDGNRDTLTHRFQWFQNGTLRQDLTTDTVPASETMKGDRWKAVIVPNDGKVDGIAAEATATVVNTPPVATVTLDADPATDEDLAAVADGEDADDDAIVYTYAWTRDGEPVSRATATIPASETSHGETWTVTVTPNDGEADGDAVTASVVVANTAPGVDSVTLSPSPAYEDTLVTATVAGVDELDDDQVTLTYAWYVNDTAVQIGPDDSLSGALFDKHDLVRVEVTPNDGYTDGATVASDDLLVENSVPTGASVTIVSSSPDGAVYEDSTVTCTPTGWADADGDVERWIFAWTADGVTVSTSPSIDGALFAKGQRLTCTATPTDGEASGTPLASAASTVANTAPVLADAALSTYAPTESDTLSVTLGATTDADGDAITLDYAWYVNGRVVARSTTLAASRFAKGDILYVVMTPWDGEDYGTPVTSSVATAVNTPPTLGTVSISPSSVATNGTLYASASATDPDGDTVTYVYAWYVNGLPRGSGSASLSGSVHFEKDDEVYLVVTPNDGEDDGAPKTSSSVTVKDMPPSAPVVAISPGAPMPGDDLVCEVVTASTDVDDDAITYTFSWTLDGFPYTAATDDATSSTVDGAEVSDGDYWACEVVATADGATSSDSDAVDVTLVEGCDGVDNDGDGSVDEDGDCPCPTYTYGGHGYMVCSTTATYAATKSFCSAFDYHPLKLESSAENTYIRARTSNQYWVGLEESGGVFRWYDGTTPSYTAWDSSWGQPDAPTDEPCAVSWTSGWHDVVCSLTYYAIVCESDG